MMPRKEGKMHHELHELLTCTGQYRSVIIRLRRGDSVSDPKRPGKVVRGPLRGTLKVKGGQGLETDKVAMREIRAAVGDRMKIMADSGFRRGADIVIEAARPRALTQLGIDADALVRETPGLVDRVMRRDLL